MDTKILIQEHKTLGSNLKQSESYRFQSAKSNRKEKLHQALDKVSYVLKKRLFESFNAFGFRKIFMLNLIVLLTKNFETSQVASKFFFWKQTSTRSKKILTGMTILENQRKRNLKKGQKNELTTINNEKALTIIVRTIKRLRKAKLFESFIELLRNQIKEEKVCAYVKIKKKQKMKKIFKDWKFLSKISQIKKKFFKNILKQIFRKTLKNTFYQIISESKEKKKIFFLSGIENLNKIIRKNYFFFFSKTKKLFFSRFSTVLSEIFYGKLKKIQKKLYSHAFEILKTHKKTENYSKSIQKIIKTITKKQNFLIKTVFLSLKSYFHTRKTKALLWRMKFYQLEGLILQKKEESDTQSKKYYFDYWNIIVKKINEITRKVLIKRSVKFYSILNSTTQRYQRSLKLYSYYLIQSILYNQNLSIKKIDILWKKQKKFFFFKKWKNINKSPKICRNSEYYVRSSISQGSGSSPRASFSNRESYQIPKRYGFYSVKKLSVDNVHRYIDQMIKVLPANEPALFPNRLSNHPALSYTSESRHRNSSHYTSK